MTTFKELQDRGLVRQTTGESRVTELINGKPITFYIGFDPTANSLHIGHLLQLITAKRLVNAGHKFIALIGGATAMVGDISGKSDTRKILSKDKVDANAKAIQHQIERIMQGEITIVNNNEWSDNINYLDFIRDIGSCFSVNNMLRAECFKARLNNGGLSFLEFNYMLLQAHDFLHLHQTRGCVLQLGGDDQWSNILAGIELVHKKDRADVFGLTLSLLLNAAGEKMGKTLGGTIWLDGEKTKPYPFSQYWRNIPDADVHRCFEVMTFISMADIEKIMSGDINKAKELLAWQITALVHSVTIADQVRLQAQDLSASKRITFDPIAAREIDDKDWSGQELVLLFEEWATSKSAANRLMDNNGVKIQNGHDPNLLKSRDVVSRKLYGDNFILIKGGHDIRHFKFAERQKRS